MPELYHKAARAALWYKRSVAISPARRFAGSVPFGLPQKESHPQFQAESAGSVANTSVP